MDADNPRPYLLFSGKLAICCTGLLLGLIPLFTRILVDKLYCTWIVLFRVAITFFAIAGVVSVKGAFGKNNGRFWIAPNHIKYFLGYGVISIAAVNYFYIKSLTLTTPAVAIISVFTIAPLTTLIVSYLTRKEEINKAEVVCVISIIAGSVLVNMNGIDHPRQFMGVMYATLAGACYGFYSIFGKRLTEDYDYPVMMFWQFAIAMFATVLIVVAIPNKEGVSIIESLKVLGTKEFSAILGIGIISTFIPYICYSFGLKNGVKATTASALTMLEPISTTVIAYFFINEPLGVLQIIGIVIVVFVSYQLTKLKK